MLIPDDLLQDKKILLGVTGSIAVYKSLELVRLFVKAGAEVRVIMSESAKKFVAPLSFETLTSNRVLDDTNESWVNDHNHIKIGEWADLFVIAPCTVNTIGKLSNGIADAILLQTAIAYPRTKLLAPSANTNMLKNPITQENIAKLLQNKYELVDTQVKELACKMVGDGAMADPQDIFWHAARLLLQNDFYKGRKVFVTGGGTIEKIDDVRYISNFSSGKMASALASALSCLGADVTLVATKHEENVPTNITLHRVTSSEGMFQALSELTQSKDEKKPYLFMAAAVSDYLPTPSSGKLKKETLGERFSLEMQQNIDILSSLNKDNLVCVGFKAEMDVQNATANAQKMLEKKQLDAVCLNVLKDDSSFGTDDNQIDFITKECIDSLPSSDKLSLAFQILRLAQGLA